MVSPTKSSMASAGPPFRCARSSGMHPPPAICAPAAATTGHEDMGRVLRWQQEAGVNRSQTS